jgi:hypothetical protein
VRQRCRAQLQRDANDLPPVGRAGCLCHHGRDLFASKKSFLFAKRPSGGAWKKIWSLREVSGPTPPARWSGGRYPFFEIFQIGTPFSNLIFFDPFLKKALDLARFIRLPSRPIVLVRVRYDFECSMTSTATDWAFSPGS